MVPTLHEYKTILVLGGYGRLGSELCRFLLKEPTTKVIVAGRQINKAEEMALKLKIDFPPNRVLFRYADASNYNSLLNAFRDVDLLIVASNTSRIAGQIAKAALETNIDYMDTYSDSTELSILESMQTLITNSNRPFITGTNLYSSLPSILIRCGESYFEKYDKANLLFEIKDQKYNKDIIEEFIDSFISYKNSNLLQGISRNSGRTDSRIFYTGTPHGFQRSWPINNITIDNIVKKLDLLEGGLFITNFNFLGNIILVFLNRLSQKLKRSLLKGVLRQILIWSVTSFSGGKDSVRCTLVAEGKKDFNYRKLIISIEHPSCFDLTSIILKAFIKQYLDKKINKSGLCIMGNHVDSDRLLIDMENMGVNIRTMLGEDLQARK